MQALKFIALSICIVISSSAVAQTEKTDSIRVHGECGMCKNRIQKSLKTEGVTSAKWDADAQQLIVTYNPAVISNDDIQKKVAAVGHDTELYSASDEVYNKLPGCCKYERPKSQKD